MTGMEQVRFLYETYIEQGEKLEANRKFTDGLFGFGKKPSDDPCHANFVQALKEHLEDWTRRGADSARLREAAAFIFQAPKEHEKPLSVYWPLGAAQASVQAVIPGLNREDAQALAEQFKAIYRRWERMPAQEQMLKALEKAAK